jgi:hypothetical protein
VAVAISFVRTDGKTGSRFAMPIKLFEREKGHSGFASAA